MLQLKPFEVRPKAMHELIIMPQFADVLDDNGNMLIPSDEADDWIVMDDVKSSRPVIDLFGNANVLKRRDATCKLIYSPVAKLGARYITTEKLYAATEDCTNEFYQGAFDDYEAENFDIFFENVMPILEKGIATDLYSNRWFGDVSRMSDTTGVWSWNKFDGIFKWYAHYIADGTIPASQTFTITGGALTSTQANDALTTAFNKQDGIMKFFPKEDKAFYVDDALAEAYHDYLISSGQTVMADKMSGKPILYKKGILVKPKKWDGILSALNGGTDAHAVILTLKGNFIYGADSDYGGGPRDNEAVRIWYSNDDNVWKRQVHLKAGTQIAAPQHSVIGVTSI